MFSRSDYFDDAPVMRKTGVVRTHPTADVDALSVWSVPEGVTSYRPYFEGTAEFFAGTRTGTELATFTRISDAVLVNQRDGPGLATVVVHDGAHGLVTPASPQSHTYRG